MFFGGLGFVASARERVVCGFDIRQNFLCFWVLDFVSVVVWVWWFDVVSLFLSA